MQRAHLIAWLESRPDQREPLPFDQVDRAQQLEAGRALLLAGDLQPWFVKLRLHGPVMKTWLPRQPLGGVHISRQNPIALLWAEEHEIRRHHCGALALLRDAAAGDGTALAWILRQKGWPAAAALVEAKADEDGIYETGAGRVPVKCPSPRRLLLAAFAHRPQELQWIEELCDGAEDWDSGPEALRVPAG